MSVCTRPTHDEAKQYIEALDFSMIVKKMVLEENWGQDDVEDCAKLYKNFLYLKSKYGDQYQIPPSEEIDLFWHHHILDTRKYIEDCNAIFGEYLHHYPYAGFDGITTKGQLRQYLKKVQELHKKEFGFYIYKIRLSMWEIISYLPKFILRYKV